VRTTDISTPVKVPMFPAYAISAPWKPVPRAVQALPTSSAPYLKIMATELRKRGINAPVLMSQVLKTDLDNDRVDEVILVAQRPALVLDGMRRVQSKYERAVGDYSLVLVRKVIGGKVTTLVLGERKVTKLFDGTTDGQPTVLTQWISAIADIDGDGKMEIFVDDYVHEGTAVTIFGWNDKLFKKVLEWGCGV
jgi:hypothetical protein